MEFIELPGFRWVSREDGTPSDPRQGGSTPVPALTGKPQLGGTYVRQVNGNDGSAIDVKSGGPGVGQVPGGGARHFGLDQVACDIERAVSDMVFLGMNPCLGGPLPMDGYPFGEHQKNGHENQEQKNDDNQGHAPSGSVFVWRTPSLRAGGLSCENWCEGLRFQWVFLRDP
jgi:hypothetical protein